MKPAAGDGKLDYLNMLSSVFRIQDAIHKDAHFHMGNAFDNELTFI